MFEQLNTFTVMMELNNDGTKSSKLITAPALFIMQEFIGLMQQISQSNVPISLSISRSEPAFDQFEQKETSNEYNITFKNNAFIAKYGE